MWSQSAEGVGAIVRLVAFLRTRACCPIETLSCQGKACTTAPLGRSLKTLQVALHYKNLVDFGGHASHPAWPRGMLLSLLLLHHGQSTTKELNKRMLKNYRTS